MAQSSTANGYTQESVVSNLYPGRLYISKNLQTGATREIGTFLHYRCDWEVNSIVYIPVFLENGVHREYMGVRDPANALNEMNKGRVGSIIEPQNPRTKDGTTSAIAMKPVDTTVESTDYGSLGMANLMSNAGRAGKPMGPKKRTNRTSRKNSRKSRKNSRKLRKSRKTRKRN